MHPAGEMDGLDEDPLDMDDQMEGTEEIANEVRAEASARALGSYSNQQVSFGKTTTLHLALIEGKEFLAVQNSVYFSY